VAAIDVAPAPIETAGFKSARGLANAIAFVLGVEAVVEVGSVVHWLVTIGVMERVVAGEHFERRVFTAIDVRTNALAALSGLLSLTAIVLFCLFMPRANRNARWFRAPLSNSPGWSAGWFFIPIAQWWKPYAAMKEIWQGSDPDPSVAASQAPGSALISWWWVMYVVRTIGGMASNQLRHVKTATDLIDASWVQIVFRPPSILAALLAGMVVRALARRQDERQRRELATPTGSVTAGAAP